MCYAIENQPHDYYRYKKFLCNKHTICVSITYVYIFFLATGYCAGQWYFHTSVCVNVRNIKYACCHRTERQLLRLLLRSIISHARRHRREVKVDTVNDKEATRLQRARLQPSVNYARFIVSWEQPWFSLKRTLVRTFTARLVRPSMTGDIRHDRQALRSLCIGMKHARETRNRRTTGTVSGPPRIAKRHIIFLLRGIARSFLSEQNSPTRNTRKRDE